ncbi:LysR substrate-binding domain-containing protein [Burkholderia multivorans]|uniref:LysR substrate-binding domain-containing protein n=1 Tax=Burkholderia multivorans TaxID=87883 RepID=UPI0009E0DFCE|nr:LysR substrate-binding domain-containing protein [Burkholderia multivorans]MBU9315489.1 LysR family transcriptional regulator [Burkholderia multivorans]MBU9666615.1 LysR family transcriptional regulator [Burkholderia multivorans]MCL4650178.1 LysR substrate-binding domain-containing protein [Burkholderia multivorans]MCL4657081.1 LysR substrate-binding domain-containing protein [Burkholderia multivorans]MCO1423011.1 LysR substrate-binding domain-containing protein [Burkholderia multivorans]
MTKATKGYRRIVPSLTALVEFEAVARLGSFTHAAAELGVTQAAVSRQVRFLEETLDVRLFHRLHRSISLTNEGEMLYVAVAESMQRIAGAFDRLSTGADQQELVLAATASFAQFRLLPRLPKLKHLNPPLKLRLTTQMFTADLRHVEVDVAVRYGDGKWADGTSILLFDEEVFPVCSPAFLKENGTPESVEALGALPLIESDSTSEGWMGWEAWFRSVGHRPPKLDYALRCTLYTDAIQAARYGQGVALGWSRLVQDLLATGELVRIPVGSCKTSDAYFVIVPHGRSLTPAVTQLIDWLREELPVR